MVACALVLIVLLWLAPFFETLPNVSRIELTKFTLPQKYLNVDSLAYQMSGFLPVCAGVHHYCGTEGYVHAV